MAQNTNGLSDIAIEILKIELAQRKLEVTTKSSFVPISSYNNVPSTPTDISIKYSNAVKIFPIDKISVFKLALLPLMLSVLASTIPFLLVGNERELMTATCFFLAALFFIVSVYAIVFISTKKVLLLVTNDQIWFHRKMFRNGSKLAIFDMVQFYRPNQYTKIKIEQIKNVTRKTNFTRVRNIYFTLQDNTIIEIQFLGSEKYLEEIHYYLEHEVIIPPVTS